MGGGGASNIINPVIYAHNMYLHLLCVIPGIWRGSDCWCHWIELRASYDCRSLFLYAVNVLRRRRRRIAAGSATFSLVVAQGNMKDFADMNHWAA